MFKKNIGLVCTLVLLANAAVVPTAATQAATDEATPAAVAQTQAAPTSTPVKATPAVATTAAESIDQWMPNKILQQVVLRSLNSSSLSTGPHNFTSVDQITQADMLYLTRISEGDITHIDGQTSFSLEGLQYATNLTEIMLQSSVSTAYYGDITDVSPLAGLTKLTDLELTGNRITDVTPLAGLTNLKQLGLAFNHIGDFSSLSSLTKASISYNDQVVILPKITINSQTRTATLPTVFKLTNGAVAPLTYKSGVLTPVKYDTSNAAAPFYYSIYYAGGYATQNAAGGLDYNTIQDQLPPVTSIPSMPNVTVVPVENKYYLIGVASTANGGTLTQIQPYSLATSAADVTVNYQDEAGKEVAPSETLTGLVGDDYQSELKTVAGYTFKEVKDNNATGKFTDAAQTVTYVYTKDPVKGADVTVNYEDEAGNEIAGSETLTGNVGADYVSEQKAIAGYTFKAVKDNNATGKFTDAAQTVTYVYTKDPVKGADVTVNYQDEAGNKVADSETLSGNIGDSYTTEQKTVPGYTFKEVKQSRMAGIFTDTAQTVTYVYTKDPVVTSNVYAQYQDEAGHELAKTEAFQGAIGTTYQTQQKTIAGYHFKQVTGAQPTGLFTTAAQTVTYIYTKDPVTPTKPVVPGTDDNSNILLPKTGGSQTVAPKQVANQTKQQAAATLPKTNEKRQLGLQIAGLAVLVLTAGLLFVPKRHRD
ncbi:MucBP domain-containing protein [Lapidilactobacillus wuchangensis]|uniref:MucBP domain-containing protein n=1 Tax=Lapidilactobacillus wuchangensis TaxID=2486001 RepID=UPI000F7AEB48|nr:MucBP domain-containing protein [Lapidilactobacillus wuchangensis]